VLATDSLSVFGRHRSLVLELTKREILGRYRGASIGLLWSVLSPFLMLGVYTLAFGFLMKNRWPGADGSTTNFAVILFAGLIIHGFFAECLMRSPQLVVGNPSYVKRVVFPLETLTWSMVFSALFHLAMNVLVLLVLKTFLGGPPSWTVVLLPLVVLPLVIFAVGMGWFLSALGVYLRDIGQLVGVVSSAMLFLSSAMVPVQSLPESYRWLFMLNPLTLIIDQAREVVLWGRTPNWGALGLYTVVALGVFVGGDAMFRKLRKGFADVL
jgi:lipopolysaccharide transport system permease protein